MEDVRQMDDAFCRDESPKAIVLAFTVKVCYARRPMTLESLQPLLTELDAWSKAGLTAELWWRDDNAIVPTVELDRLIAVSDRLGVPCGLAAIPAGAGEPLRKAVSGATRLWVLQHGFSHADHAPGADHNELGLHRPKSVVLEELRQGMLKFNQLFKSRFVPVLVPPWSHIDSQLVPYLPVMGFRGLSCLHGEHLPVTPGDLRMVNVHCDVLHWSDTLEVGLAAEACLEGLIGHLRDKRLGRADETEPTGMRTHHLDMDADAWEFLASLFELTLAHPAAVWVSPPFIWPERD